jgi:hypothetical protein
MIVKQFIVKIVDFGMAKKVNDVYSAQIDSQSSTVGTIPYMVFVF